MTDMRDDLATLLYMAERFGFAKGIEAARRVEAELARLEAERDEDRIAYVNRESTLVDEVARLRQERDAWDAVQDNVRREYLAASRDVFARAEAAEDEVARLREGLRPLAPLFVELDDMSLSLTDERIDELRDQIVAIARSLLADNQEDPKRRDEKVSKT